MSGRIAEAAKAVDRTGWDPGPWDGEPDRVEWMTAAGLPALIVRQHGSGHLCGYVAVSAEHRLYACSYSRPRVEVHGGLTYANKCHGDVCHVPQPGESDDVWWFGFDANHMNDHAPNPNGVPYVPSFLGGDDLSGHGGTYRTVAFMRAECEKLAEQLKAVA